MFIDRQLALAEAVLDACREAGLRVAVAESCTGGLVAGCLTSISGSSDVFERGFVPYTNEAKVELLWFPDTLTARHGAFSAEATHNGNGQRESVRELLRNPGFAAAMKDESRTNTYGPRGLLRAS